MGYKHKYSDFEFVKIVESSLSYTQVMVKLNIKPIGGNYKTIKNRITKLNINISHFTGERWNIISGRATRIRKNLKEILKENSIYNTCRLKKRLIEEKILENKCTICKIDSWQGKIISLELDHINGINNDNRIENLRVICPNCHSQTLNYRGKNKKIKKLSFCLVCGKESGKKKYCSKECYNKTKFR